MHWQEMCKSLASKLRTGGVSLSTRKPEAKRTLEGVIRAACGRLQHAGATVFVGRRRRRQQLPLPQLGRHRQVAVGVLRRQKVMQLTTQSETRGMAGKALSRQKRFSERARTPLLA